MLSNPSKVNIDYILHVVDIYELELDWKCPFFHQITSYMSFRGCSKCRYFIIARHPFRRTVISELKLSLLRNILWTFLPCTWETLHLLKKTKSNTKTNRQNLNKTPPWWKSNNKWTNLLLKTNYDISNTTILKTKVNVK